VESTKREAVQRKSGERGKRDKQKQATKARGGNPPIKKRKSSKLLQSKEERRVEG